MDDYIAMSFPKLLSPITHLQDERTLEIFAKYIPARKQTASMRNAFLHLSEGWQLPICCRSGAWHTQCCGRGPLPCASSTSLSQGHQPL